METKSLDHATIPVMMSLSLDGLLAPDDEQLLARHLESCTECQEVWQRWQQVDETLQTAPVVMAPDGFTLRLEERMQRAEEQRALRMGILLAGMSMLLWTAGLVGIGLLFGWLVYNQVGIVGEISQWAVQSWVLIQALGASIWRVVLSMGSNPSAVGGLVAYASAFLGILYGWSKLLQRSIQPVDIFENA